MSEKRASRSLGRGNAVAVAPARDALDVENFEPTGDIEETDNGRQIVISREMPQSPKVIWGYLEDAARISRWFGNCHTKGDTLHLSVTADDIETSYDVTIAESNPYTYLHLAVNDHQGHDLDLRFYLTEEDNHETYLEFHHSVDGVEDQIGLIAPKWELILDRLEIALEGGNIKDVQLENYYPCQLAHYDLAAKN
ncbi:toxin-antitoxin system toxin subunit [Corynebacterium sp. L4756]|uniref:toxin-antitoxin system toxin subunit n=1 Tax=unclassified Corynebacterium TaxID=2624378 RepID=UPI00374D4A8A